MDSLARNSDFPDPRLIYWLDAGASLAFGIALLATAVPLTHLAGWSVPSGVLTAIGLALLPWALFNFIIARSAEPVLVMVRINIIGDLFWVLGSAILMLTQAAQLTPVGWALMVGQALAVGGVLATKMLGAGRARA